MKINNIKVYSESLLGVEIISSYDLANNKPIGIFYLSNSKGKSLIFNALEHLFSNDRSQFIKDTNKDLCVQINFSINEIKYRFISTFFKPFQITCGEVALSSQEFEHILRQNMLIGDDLEYYGKIKTSLKSINRFVFLDNEGIRNNEEKNEIYLIDARYDGQSKKLLLSYILGGEIDAENFKLITEVEYKKVFLQKNKTLYDKYLLEVNTINKIKDNLGSYFVQLEKNRVIRGDLLIAIKELDIMLFEYAKIMSEDEDYYTLQREVLSMRNLLHETEVEIDNIYTTIRGSQKYEKSELLADKSSILKNNELEIVDRCREYDLDLQGIDMLKLDTYIEFTVMPSIREFKNSLRELYYIFTKYLILKNIRKKGDFIADYDNIIFHEDTLLIEMLFQTSEGLRETVRTLTFMGLHILSKQKHTRCLGSSFYDSFIERVDSTHREILLDSIIEFVESNNLILPDMYLFITRVEKNINNSSVSMISEEYNQYISLYK